MKYRYPADLAKAADAGCREFGHTWQRHFPRWRALLRLSQTCHRCGMKRWAERASK